MEKFDEVLDSAKLRVMGLREGSITRTQLALEEIIHAIELLSDEVELLKQKTQKLIDAGDVMYKLLEPPSISMRTSIVDNSLQGWDDAKIK